MKTHHHGGGGDLFSEVHMSEIQKFEELLAESEKNRDVLQTENSELKSQIDEHEKKVAGRAGLSLPESPCIDEHEKKVAGWAGSSLPESPCGLYIQS